MRCEKCGRPISSRLHGTCMKCRYEDMRSAPVTRGQIMDKRTAKAEPKIEEKSCVICGKAFTPPNRRKKNTCSPECSAELHRRNVRKNHDARRTKTHPPKKCISCGEEFIPETGLVKKCKACRNLNTTAFCVSCGEIFFQNMDSEEAKCPECRKKGRKGVKRFETPTRGTYLRPGGWTGPIEPGPKNRTAKARLCIPVEKMPKPMLPPTRSVHTQEKPDRQWRTWGPSQMEAAEGEKAAEKED